MELSNNLDMLVLARRLILHAQRAEDRRNGKQVEEKTLRDEMEEDCALISGNTPVEGVDGQIETPKNDEVQIKLSDLCARLKTADPGQAGNETGEVQVNFQQTAERKISYRYAVLERVEGLVRRSQTLAETDRYALEFSDGITFKITDKWSNRSTTIWGDPHVDVDDVDGNRDGEFEDLKASNSHTTLMLQDGTRVTFTALDNGVIEAVDIFKGDQHLGGIGSASKKWSPENGLFAISVDQNSVSSTSVPTGDTVYAGGDGNDWFTAGGRLLWGKTTGPAIYSRPYAVMQMEYQEKISSQISMQVNKLT